LYEETSMSFDDLYELAKRRRREERWFATNNDRLHNLNANVKKAVQDRDYFRERFQDGQQENLELSQKNRKAQVQIRTLSYDNDNLTKKNDALACERDNLKCQNERISGRLCVLENEAENARDLLARVRVKYSAKIKDAESTIDSLECRLNNAKQDIDALKCEKANLTEQVCRLRGDKCELQATVADLKDKDDTNQCLIRDLRKQVRVKQAAVETLSDDLKAEQEKNCSLQRENCVLRSKNCELEEKAKDDAETIRILSKKIDALECEKSNLQNDVCRLRSRLYDAQKALKPMTCMLAQYSSEMDDMDGMLGRKSGRRSSSRYERDERERAERDWESERYRSSRRRRAESKGSAKDERVRSPKSKEQKKEDDLFKELDKMQSRINRLNLNIERLDNKKVQSSDESGAEGGSELNGLSKWELEQLFEQQGFSGYERDRLVKKALEFDQTILASMERR